jgi:hypothetical protein
MARPFDAPCFFVSRKVSSSPNFRFLLWLTDPAETAALAADNQKDNKYRKTFTEYEKNRMENTGKKQHCIAP